MYVYYVYTQSNVISILKQSKLVLRQLSAKLGPTGAYLHTVINYMHDCGNNLIY